MTTPVYGMHQEIASRTFFKRALCVGERSTDFPVVKTSGSLAESSIPRLTPPHRRRNTFIVFLHGLLEQCTARKRCLKDSVDGRRMQQRAMGQRASERCSERSVLAKASAVLAARDRNLHRRNLPPTHTLHRLTTPNTIVAVAITDMHGSKAQLVASLRCCNGQLRAASTAMAMKPVVCQAHSA